MMRGWQRVHLPGSLGLLGLLAALLSAPAAAQDLPDETVHFASADGRTTLVGYVFRPVGPQPHAAVVMLHGRAGPYSSAVSGGCSRVGAGIESPCGAATLSRRHLMWGRFWAEHGFVALHVDSFGPRGKAQGFGRFSHDDPAREDVNERSVRPLDAVGALRYLRSRSDVDPARVGLQGWSNGASTVLNTVADGATANAMLGDSAPFSIAVAFYPGCGPAAVTERHYAATVPLLVLLGNADEEVSPEVCARLLAAAANTSVRRYAGASHDFDDPGRQKAPANAAARADAMAETERRFVQALSR